MIERAVTERRSEAGFSLLEVVVCVALLVVGSVLALALLPALAHASQAQLLRSAATDIARNAIERARAAAAYYPAAIVADPTQRAAATADHAWVFAPAANYVAAVRVHRAYCGSAAATSTVSMNVNLTYDGPSDTLTVAVAYPPNPCDVAVQSSVTFATQLAPASYAPQTQLPAAIADPALQ
jgi:prepilin-type N-terminal cleavage/methylation domain-containing protein